MIFKTVFLLFLSFNIYASTHIKERYYIDAHTIDSSLFFKDQANKKLYEIPSHKHSLRIKRAQLKKLLKDNGFRDFKIDSRYIYFEVKSPIDATKIKEFLKDHYTQKYENIDIKNIDIKPRSYMKKLPDDFTMDIRRRNHLSKDGILSIEDTFHKKYFFNYLIDAELDVVVPKEKIRKDEEISKLNAKLKSIRLDRFRALPLQHIPASKYQAKHHIKADKIITYRDIEKLSLVKRNSTVNVTLNNSGIIISFAAKALQSGKLNDIITIQKGNGKRLKAKVVAKQKVEIR